MAGLLSRTLIASGFWSGRLYTMVGGAALFTGRFGPGPVVMGTGVGLMAVSGLFASYKDVDLKRPFDKFSGYDPDWDRR